MLVVPLPPMMLDLFITLNISAALAVVVATMYLTRPLDFSVFPSLLLLTTMFRLAINVSVTRLILTKGDAGSVVKAFGQFVVGGNVVVGLVIFLILVVIQFVVVTNGAGRVAEVAARFTLDAMPGKQMAIDADLNAGLITDEQARNRRSEIAREADFYGAMDGASKFVKGDAMAAVLITAINLIGGIVVGVLQHGLPFGEATQHYSLLTVGDGLAAQIPALLISVATGILVTRSASEKDLGTDIANQILRQRKAPMVAGAVICLFALVPGLPKLPFLFIGIMFLAIGRAVRNGMPDELEAAAAAAALPAGDKPEAPAAPREEVMKELPIDPLELGIGFGLVPLVDRRGGGTLVRRVSVDPPPDRRRARHGDPAGPDPRRDRPRLPRVRVQGPRHAGRPRLDHGRPPAGDGPGRRRRLAAGNPDDRARVRPAGDLDPGVPARRGRGPRLHRRRRRVGDRHPPDRDDPHARGAAAHASGRQAIARSAQGNQRSCRYRGRARRALARRDSARTAGPPRRGRVDPRSRRDRRGRRRQGAGHARPRLLAEYARQALGRAITAPHLDPTHTLRVITLDPAIEQELATSITQTTDGEYLAMEPARAQAVLGAVRSQSEHAAGRGGARPVLLCSARVRRHVRRLVEAAVPHLPVCSYNEIASGISVETIGVVTA